MSQETVTNDASAPTEESETMIEVDELKTYYESGGFLGGTPVKAVDGVSFDIKRGETLGLVGESGCGKTTLGRTLIQLEQATDGEIRFDGKDITTLSRDELHEWRKNAQMVFQDPDSSLNDRMTIGEIIREPLDVHEVGTPEERQRQVKELLATVGLQREHYFRYPHQFSGGQRQRIGIARTLALEPEFIVLDEPVSALDVSVQAEIINLLEDLQEEFGLTYLFIAHDLSVVRHICDRVAVMYLGNIMEIGPTEELFSDPANPYTHALLSAIPRPDPTARGDRITLHGTPPNPRYPPSGCPFSTRCPAHIQPEQFEEVDDDVWTRVVQFREVLNERSRANRSIRERIRERIGGETRFETMEEAVEDLFGDVDVAANVQSEIAEISDLARNQGEDAALERFNEVFGSICDQKEPAYYDVSDTDHQSFCHRHKSEFEDPEPVIESRHG